MYMSYEEFVKKLNEKIVEGEDFYTHLLETIIDNPNRYTGIFRISSVKTKLVQNVTQSNEIKFGDFLEEIVTEYISRLGYRNLKKDIGVDDNGDALNTDQLFMDSKNTLYLIEQKVRDDHDSTKKRGQFQNFTKKVLLLKKLYPNCNLIASMWFIDDGLVKNKNYYRGEMKNFNEKNVSLNLFYGSEMFKELLKSPDAWNEIIEYLNKNKLNRAKEVLTIPDFDESEEILLALQKISSKHMNKLLSDKPQYIQLRKELFPNNINLKKLNLLR